MTRLSQTLALTLSLMLVATQAAAHAGPGAHSGFASGFLHPMLGVDHVIAMVAVGLWAARLGGASVWVLPLVFPLVMAFGAALGLMGVTLPAVEAGIALSGVVLGLIIAVALRAPVAVAAAIVGGFAVFHGHAHGTEVPGEVGVWGYGFGFVAGTALLHMAGIGLAALMRGALGARAVQGTGAGIAMLGGAFLIGLA
jgi:urease accessory protein